MAAGFVVTVNGDLCKTQFVCVTADEVGSIVPESGEQSLEYYRDQEIAEGYISLVYKVKDSNLILVDLKNL